MLIYTLSLHDALPISAASATAACDIRRSRPQPSPAGVRPRQPGVPSPGTSAGVAGRTADVAEAVIVGTRRLRSEEHTSELQSRENLVCRLVLEKKIIK